MSTTPKMPKSVSFDSSKWISVQQCYPEANVPKDVLREHCRLLQPPQYYRGLIPLPTLAVQTLLDITLPSLDNDLTLGVETFSFSYAEADATLPFDIATRTIPPAAITSTLLLRFGQHWFNGARSIQDSRRPTQFLPFWVISYWNRLARVLDARHAWSTARAWIIECADASHPQFHVVRDALTLFETLGWNIMLQGAASGMRSCEWADFLSSNTVKGAFVEVMMKTVELQVQRTCHLSGVVSVEDLVFSHALRYDRLRWKGYEFDRSFCHLRRVGDALFNGSQVQVLFPINIDNSHWTLFKVDAGARQIKYGDTLGWSWPAPDVERIQFWLRQHGQDPFEKAGDMPHGNQQDSYSCAIGMVNIARHDLFGDPLFTDANKNILRLQEFLRIVDSHSMLEAVGTFLKLVLSVFILTLFFCRYVILRCMTTRMICLQAVRLNSVTLSTTSDCQLSLPFPH